MELSFRYRVEIEELDSDFFRLAYVDLQDFIKERIANFDFKVNAHWFDGVSPKFVHIARSRLRRDLSEIFAKLHLSEFQYSLKTLNRFERIDAVKESVWNSLQTTYCSMLMVCDRYVANIMKSPFEKYAVNETFADRIIDAFIESIRYSGGFVSEDQLRYDLFWICVLSSIRKGMGDLSSRNKLVLYEKQLELLKEYETGRCGVDFIQSPQLRFFLINEIEDVRSKLRNSGRPKYNYGAHIEELKKFHQHLLVNKFTDTKFPGFVKCWEEGIGRINWLQTRTALVQFHEILQVHTTVLDLVDFESFIIDNYSIKGVNVFDVESIVKKKDGLGNGDIGLKNFRKLFPIVNMLVSEYQKSPSGYRGE